jgi:hypothetical protein
LELRLTNLILVIDVAPNVKEKSEFFGLGNKSSTEMDKLLSNVS